MDIPLFFDVVAYVILTFGLIITLFSLPSIILRMRLARHRGDFECMMCGNCCRFSIITLNDEDTRRIEAHGHKDFYEVLDSGEKKLKMANGRCMFVKDDACTIHDIKPEVCRNFPFSRLYGVIPFSRDWRCCVGIQKLKEKIGKNRGNNPKVC